MGIKKSGPIHLINGIINIGLELIYSMNTDSQLSITILSTGIEETQ